MKTPVEVYSEFTPNPNAVRFVTNKRLTTGRDYHFNSINDASKSKIAYSLFSFPFIERIFFTVSSITIVAKKGIDWLDVVRDVREFVQELIEKNFDEVLDTGEDINENNQSSVTESHSKPNSDIEKQIIEALEEYIRPAVERDGGAIYFKGYDSGVVKVALRGACSGCPSSTVTLKSGIENLLKNNFPNKVTEVVSI